MLLVLVLVLVGMLLRRMMRSAQAMVPTLKPLRSAVLVTPVRLIPLMALKTLKTLKTLQPMAMLTMLTMLLARPPTAGLRRWLRRRVRFRAEAR